MAEAHEASNSGHMSTAAHPERSADACDGGVGEGAAGELVLNAGDYEAHINHVGASLRSLTFKGHPLTDTYSLDDGDTSDDGSGGIPFCAGIVLAPWPNRVRDGAFTYQGESYNLELTEPERDNAIHGLVGTRVWQDTTPDSANEGTDHRVGELTGHIAPTTGWPWAMTVTARFELNEDAGLTATYTVSNDSEDVAPVAFGVHTYLNAWGTPLDECTAYVPVTDCLPLDSERNLPVEPLRLVPLREGNAQAETQLGIPRDDGDNARETANLPSSLDFESGQPLHGVWLDHAFVDARSAAEPRRIQLVHTSGHGVELTADPAMNWFQIFTADPNHGQGFPGRGRALAVEPQTASPDALRSGVGLVDLAPGSVTTYSITMRAVSG